MERIYDYNFNDDQDCDNNDVNNSDKYDAKNKDDNEPFFRSSTVVTLQLFPGVFHHFSFNLCRVPSSSNSRIPIFTFLV